MSDTSVSVQGLARKRRISHSSHDQRKVNRVLVGIGNSTLKLNTSLYSPFTVPS